MIILIRLIIASDPKNLWLPNYKLIESCDEKEEGKCKLIPT